jgi:hypothetical protein
VFIVNGSFEEADFAEGFQLVDAGAVPGWSSANQIEIWRSGLAGIQAQHGSYLIELNGAGPSTISQDISTTPGSTIRVAFAHRGRFDDDSMQLLIGRPGQNLPVALTATTGTSGWEVYRVTYTVPAGQTTTRLAFRSVDGGGAGNLLDAIQVSLD